MKINLAAVAAVAALMGYPAARASARDDAPGGEPAPPVIGEVSATSLYLQAATVDASRARDVAELARLIEAGGARTGRWVVQLDGPMRPAWRERLTAAGVRVGDYLPLNAFIVTLGAADNKAVAGLEFVRWFEAFKPEWKIAPGIGTRTYLTAERRQARAAGQVEVLVTLFAGEAPDTALRAIAAMKDAQVHWISQIAGNETLSASLRAADVPALAAIEPVQFVEESPEIEPRNDTDRWIVQSNVAGSYPLYDHGLHGEGQILGLLDTHLDRNHCSFFDPSNPIGPLHRKILAYNTGAGAEFHGTHVCGTAVGDAGNETATRGIAYLGKVVYNGIPSFTETDVMMRLNLHHTQGARVHTNSWGDDGTTAYNALCRGFDSFNYNNEDDLVCLAVTNLSTLKNPENAKNLLAVGASQDTPNQANHCSGGSGPTTDGRRKPEIYAPGCNTNSASAGTSCGLTTATGTSMASPAVAATGMLVRQYYMSGLYPTGTSRSSDAFLPSGALVKATLLNSAADMTGISGYPSNQEGWGRVLADDALYFAGDAKKLIVQDTYNAEGLSTGQFIESTVTVLSSGQKLRVTLVWMDPPAASGAAFAAINDLDLEVVDPASNLYLGNVFASGQSATGGSRDIRDNVEQVLLNSPATGAWTVRVRATAVNQGTQGYAVVVTGDVANLPPGLTMDAGPTPTIIAPGMSTPMSVTVNPGADTVVPGSVQLLWRFDTSAFQSVVMTDSGGGAYIGNLPAPACGDAPEFYFTAQGVATGVVTLPPSGASAPFTARVGTLATVLNDDFESDLGWSVGGAAAGDNATGGIWTRVTPNPSAPSPPADHTPGAGTRCWVTGQDTTTGVSIDVDGGRTSLVSPALDLSQWASSSSAAVTMGYWRWYNNSTGPAPNSDVFTVELSPDNGVTWVVAETVGPGGAGTAGGWVYHELLVGDVVALTSQVRVRFVASDLGADSTVEAGVDDFGLEVFNCQAPCPCDWNGVGGLNSQDFFDFLVSFFAGNADFNGVDGTNSQDFFDFLGCFFAGCP
jgi:hypothetical protein